MMAQLIQTENLLGPKKQYGLIKVLYLLRYFGDAFFYAYYQIYLKSLNISDSRIGLLLSISPLVLILMNPFWNLITKNANVNKKIISVSTIIEGILIICFSQTTSFVPILVLTVLIAMSGTQFYSLLDGYSGTFSSVNHLDYTPIRMFGSLGYVISLLVSGFLLSYIPYSAQFIGAGSIFILCSLLLLMLHDIDLKKVSVERAKPKFSEIFHNKRFWLYTLFYVLTFTISFAGDNYVSVYFTSDTGLGLKSNLWGYIYAGMVIFEVLTMIVIARRGKNIPDYIFFIVGAFCLGIKSVLIGLDIGREITIAVSMLRGVGIGIFITIHLRHLLHILRLENLTVGILIVTLIHSLCLALANFFYPRISSVYGYPKLYLGLGLVLLAVTIIYVVTQVFDKREYENKEII